MFEKNLITIEIGDKDIKILAGNKNRIKCFGAVKTPEDSFMDDKIVDVQKLARAISDFLKEKRLGIKEVSFAIQGQDIVIRHMETPVMDRKGIRSSLEWEVSQFLPDGGKDYYFDFEITDKISTKEKRMYKVMVVSVPKDKIEKYMELAQKLKLNLAAIDIAPNNVCRVFKNVHKRKKDVESIGVMHVGINSSTFTILDKGKLFIEREVPFGVNNAAREISYDESLSMDIAVNQFVQEFSFLKADEDRIFKRVSSRFDSVFSTFETIIQFYTTGRSKKSLDMIYIIGEGAEIKGIDTYIRNYFNTASEIAEANSELGVTMKLPKDYNFKRYVNSMGLLLRKE
jgi:type IV pilus assembly protein PilM